ncbi:hypothetical protein ULF88_23010 [Halopseudomonas pachastrellae]|nr:hypothetical protein [Halopseudomonas pachastrellae]
MPAVWRCHAPAQRQERSILVLREIPRLQGNAAHRIGQACRAAQAPRGPKAS